ncbi:MAG TPA: lipase family protein [Acidimicrobiales bacterium]|nr:lipase family protein [Acidimicrobiales bacterium]
MRLSLRRRARIVAATALGALAVGTVGAAPPASAAPIVLDWTADVDSQVGGLINKTVEFPQGTFAGEVDLGTGGLTGDIALPPGTLTFNAFGLIPVTTEIKVEPEGPVTGAIDLTDLSVTANLSFDIKITQFKLAGLSVLNANNDCRTTAPIAAALAGQLDPSLGAATLAGTYTIGNFSGCGFFGAFVNLFTAGPNNSLTASLAATGSSGTAPGPEFYTPPAQLPARPGDVIRTLDVPLGGRSDVTGKAILYRSTDATGGANAVSGTLYVPTAAWTGGGSRPIVGFAPGTQGVGDGCAPSQSLPLGTNYELTTVNALLDRGWAVAVTDYEGMGTPGNPTYIVKDAEAHAVLDIVRAAQRIPGSGVGTASPVGLHGYSQGGQATAAAAEIEGTYAPELDIRGVAAGGTPSELRAVSANLDGPGNQFFSFLAFAALGLDTAYDELDLASYLNAEGQALFDQATTGEGVCLGDGLALGAGRHIADLTTANPLETPAWQARIDQQRIGTVAPASPVFVYHGSNDQVIPFAETAALRSDWCGRGAKVVHASYPVDHLGGVTAGTAASADFLAARFAGQALPATCTP